MKTTGYELLIRTLIRYYCITDFDLDSDIECHASSCQNCWKNALLKNYE